MDNIKKEIIEYINSKESGYATIDKLKANIKCDNLDSVISDMVKKLN